MGKRSKQAISTESALLSNYMLEGFSHASQTALVRVCTNLHWFLEP